MVKFEFYSGDLDWLKYGATWVSNRQSNGEFDYYFVLEILNLREDLDADAEHEYYVALYAASPQLAWDEFGGLAMAALSVEDEPADQWERAGMLQEYGLFAPLWDKEGNNANALLHEAREQAKVCESGFGLLLDRKVNALGMTGLESMIGDTNSAVARAIAQRNSL